MDSAISPPCLKTTDACSAIDGTIRVYRGVAYTFKCGYQLGFVSCPRSSFAVSVIEAVLTLLV